MPTEPYAVKMDSYKQTTNPYEFFQYGFELAQILDLINWKASKEIQFHSIHRDNILRYLDDKKINYELRDHDDYPTLVLTDI